MASNQHARQVGPCPTLNYQADIVTAATLIHVGGEDPRCPPANAQVLYRALKEFGKVDAELIIYPGEGHRLKKYDHILSKEEWDLAWFNKHLRGSDEKLPAKINADELSRRSLPHTGCAGPDLQAIYTANR